MSMRYPGGLIATTPVNQQYPSGVWTGPQTTPYQANNVWANDSSFKNTTLLLHGDGATTSFTRDASTNNFQLSLVGDTKPNNLTPYIANGYWSNYFDGATSTRLTLPSNTAFAFGTGAYTVEAWVYLVSYAASQGSIFDAGNATGAFDLFVISTGALGIGEYGVGNILASSSGAVALNAWTHVAVVRASTATNDTKLYVNGSLVATGTNTKNWTVTTTPSVGGINLSGYSTNGYISNLRVVKGSAVYTGAFTPSTTPLTAISGTSLLTCQSNRFIDNSTNAFTITPNGNTAVSMQQPFTAPSGTSQYGSGYFDGTGDWLTPPTGQTALTLGTSDFTIEMWAYPTTQVRGNPALFTSDPGAGLANTILVQFIGTTGQTILWVNNTNLTASSTTNYIRLNQWNHIAICRSGGNTYTFYINGVAVNNVATNSTSLTTNSWYIGYWTVADNAYTGNITDFRIVKGTVVYTGAFTPPTAPLTPVTNTSLLTLQTNGPENNNGFLDSSYNSFPITRTGNTTQGSFTPYEPNGYWSNLLPNTTGSCLRFGTSANLALGSGSFTVEMWVYINALASAGYSTILDWRTNGNTPANIPLLGDNNNTGKLSFVYGTGGGFTQVLESSTTMPLNAWTHIALVRNGTAVTLYFNGTSVATATNSINFGNETLSLGQPQTTGPYTPNAYFSNVRIVKGSAVYTGAFTPPTTPLTAITNTQLLTCQSNRFVDNSSNSFTVTIATTPSVQPFQPFTPTVQYTPSTLGGSGYFDGSGDYLAVADSPILELLASDFTIECWVYPTGGSGTDRSLVTKRSSGSVYGGYGLFISTSNTCGFIADNDTSAPWPVLITGSAVALNEWTHLAATRSGSTWTVWKNGVSVGTASTSITINDQATTTSIGAIGNGDQPFAGYITDARIVKGTALYTTTFTPPTSPLTPIANTQLLANFTNAAIFDNSGMSNLETVGNAQIDTSVVKYGTSSMYFDGSGDYLSIPGSASMSLGTGNFTVEMWVNISSLAATRALISFANSNVFYINTSGIVYYGIYTVADYSFASSAIPINTWVHLAFCRVGSIITCFVNGVSTGTTVSSSAAVGDTTSTSYVGYHQGGNAMFGYIDDLRVTKGVARYVGNFTPPVARMPNQ